MASIFANWKTSASGLILILLGLGGQFLGIHVPGFTGDPGTMIMAGLGLIVAKDSNVTGVPGETK